MLPPFGRSSTLTFIPLIPTNTRALQASAVDGEVVMQSRGPGLAIFLSLTPEAVLASLKPLQLAAEQALNQRATSTKSCDDTQGGASTYYVGTFADEPRRECKS